MVSEPDGFGTRYIIIDRDISSGFVNSFGRLRSFILTLTDGQNIAHRAKSCKQAMRMKAKKS